MSSVFKKFVLGFQALVVAVAVLAPVAVGAGNQQQEEMFTASAACSDKATTLQAGAECAKGPSQAKTLFGDGGIFLIVANTMIFIIGAISVIYVIIGAFRYVTSQGDSKAVTAAKDTILYSVIGIVIAIMSFAVVNFVIVALQKAN